MDLVNLKKHKKLDNEIEGVRLKRIRRSEVEVNEDCSSQQNQCSNDYTTRYGRKVQSKGT